MGKIADCQIICNMCIKKLYSNKTGKLGHSMFIHHMNTYNIYNLYLEVYRKVGILYIHLLEMS